VVLAKLETEHFGEDAQGGFHGRVRSPGGQPKERLARGNVHDVARALLLEVGQEGVNVVQGPEEVDVQELFPCLEARLGQFRLKAYARVVDQDIQSAQFTHDPAGQGVYGVSVRDVQGPGFDRDAHA